MKRFNIKDYEAGKKVCLQNGTEVEILSTKANGEYPVIWQFKHNDDTSLYKSREGGYTFGYDKYYDLYHPDEEIYFTVAYKADGSIFELRKFDCLSKAKAHRYLYELSQLTEADYYYITCKIFKGVEVTDEFIKPEDNGEI